VVLGTLALCVLAAAIAAWFQLTGDPRATGKQLRARFGLSRYDRVIGTEYFVYGVATAGLMSFAVIDVVVRGGTASAGPIALMMLPLVASLGVAEWVVYRLRSRGITLLRLSSTVQGFRVLARAQMARGVLVYGAVLLVLTVATIVLLPQDGAEAFALSTCAYGVLGLAFLCTTLLLSLRRHRLALGLAVAAVLVDSGLRLPLASYSPEATAVMHLLVFTAFLCAAFPLAMSHYSSAGAHR
jgi:hypothetical protein